MFIKRAKNRDKMILVVTARVGIFRTVGHGFVFSGENAAQCLSSKLAEIKENGVVIPCEKDDSTVEVIMPHQIIRTQVIGGVLPNLK